MAQNKKALLRYQVYDSCLKNRAINYNRAALINKVNQKLADAGLEGIAKSQFYKDLEYMQTCEWQAPIETYRVDGRVVYYRYSDPNFSINNMPLTDTDIKYLSAALDIFQNFNGLPQLDFMNDLVIALEDKLLQLSNKHSKQIVAYEDNAAYTGKKYIKPLYDAILNKKVIKFNYQNSIDNQVVSEEIIVHPMFLKNYNMLWVLIGYQDDNFKDVKVYALDRITSPTIEEQPNITYRDNDYNWAQYLSDRLGVSKPIDEDYTEYEVEIWVNNTHAQYILARPMHHTQVAIAVENAYIFKYKLLLNDELERFILSLGESAKVLRPQILIDKLHARLLAALQQYS